MKKTPQQTLNALLTAIAQKHLFIETLEERHMDRLDFHDVGVVGVRRALQEAYEAGQAQGRAQGSAA
ncbi:MAG: hypothetical protein KF740_20220 [Ramlibacter sp.]|nr:hypothetical protein [Ramlibacter sp.]